MKLNILLTPVFFVVRFLALFLCVLSTTQAKSILIHNATLYTASEKGILTQASVLMDKGKIVAINPKDKIQSDEIIDAKGKILTPGLIAVMNQLGLVEIGAVASSNDTQDEKITIDFDGSLAFNPLNTAIAYTRKGGITRSIITSDGGDDIFKGQTFVVDLTGKYTSLLKTNTGVVVVVGSEQEGSRARSLQTLMTRLEERNKQRLITLKKEKAQTQKAGLKLVNKNSKDNNTEKKTDELKKEDKILNALLRGEKPLLVYANRATDILALIKLKQRFKLDLVILEASDAELVIPQLLQAKVSIVINAIDNLPGSFDSLHTSLKTAYHLIHAGVKVGFFIQDTYKLYQLRFDAGSSIAHGVDKEAALAAITSNLSDIFHLNTGKIKKGYAADLVLWSGDPFELSTHVEKIWIAGQEYSTDSRHDALRERYLKKSLYPKAYLK
jgi:imidazolonepropionase-like amidohydrolase